MATTTVRDEKSLTELARRLYLGVKPELLPKVEAALLKANARLARPGAFVPGASVVLPDIPGVKSVLEVEHNPMLVDELRALAKDRRDELAGRLDQTRRDINDSRALLADRDVKEALKSAEGAGEILKALTETLKEREVEISRRQKSMQAMFEAMEKQLASLADLMTRA